MTGEAEHLEVFLAVVTAVENGDPVMDLERTLASRAPADLAAPAPSRDECPPARVGERRHSGSGIVGVPQLNPIRTFPDHWRGGAGLPVRAPQAKSDEIIGSVWSVLADAKETQGPRPLQSTAFAGSA